MVNICFFAFTLSVKQIVVLQVYCDIRVEIWRTKSRAKY